jgi:hypothetical protein
MGVGKRKLEREFHIARNTIDKWEAIYQKEGLSGLVNMKIGRSQKCDKIVENYIIDLDAKLNNRKGHREIIIKEVKSLYDITISRELIRRILKNHKNVNQNNQIEKWEEVESIMKMIRRVIVLEV